MLGGLSAWHAGMTQVVLAGPREDPATRTLARALARHYLPFGIVIPLEPGPRQTAVSRWLPFVAAMGGTDGQPAAYVCRDFTCRQPVTTAEDLSRQLASEP
jgi:hypothetical protein